MRTSPDPMPPINQMINRLARHLEICDRLAKGDEVVAFS
jgi:hypothetical protein